MQINNMKECTPVMDRAQLERAFAWIDFPASQQQALAALLDRINASDALCAAAHKDVCTLSDPQGDDALSAQEDALGEHAGMYPVLILLSRVDWLKAQYDRCGIPMTIFRDTLSDIPLWVDNCLRRTGEMRLLEYGWLTNYLRFSLFRLGRLEFVYAKNQFSARLYRHRASRRIAALAAPGLRFDAQGTCTGADRCFITTFSAREDAFCGHLIDADGRIDRQLTALPTRDWTAALLPGDPILEVHIPEGPPMTPAAIDAALSAAPDFFRTYLGVTDIRAFICESWLMSPAVRSVLPGSNLAAFQARFITLPSELGDQQAFERVYGHPLTRWEEMPMHTRLQKGLYAWYQSGGVWDEMQGVILLP